MTRVLMYTDRDLDGVGCAIMAMDHFGPTNVNVTYCKRNEIDNDIMRIVDEKLYQKYDRIYITDISMSMEVAERIDEHVQNGNIKHIRMLDHHKSALDKGLNKFKWATIRIQSQLKPTNGRFITKKESGTSLFAFNSDIIFNEDIMEFAEVVRAYDTYEWEETNDMVPKNLNDLLYIIGIDRFVKRFLDHADARNLTDTEKLLLELEREKMENYYVQKGKELKTVKFENFLIGVVFADRYISELGHVLCKANPLLDFVALIDPKGTVSFRSINPFIDLSEIASRYGGGGHAPAAGCPLTYDLVFSLIIMPYIDAESPKDKMDMFRQNLQVIPLDGREDGTLGNVNAILQLTETGIKLGISGEYLMMSGKEPDRYTPIFKLRTLKILECILGMNTTQIASFIKWKHQRIFNPNIPERNNTADTQKDFWIL